MRIRLDWVEVAIRLLAIVVLIPLFCHLFGIILEYLRSG